MCKNAKGVNYEGGFFAKTLELVVGRRGVYFSLKKPPDFSHDPFLNTKLGGHFQACHSIF